MVNGESVGFFLAERGLRQGDPLSPFLFIIAMEGLDSLMRRASLNNWVRGFRIKNRVNEVMDMTHLLYADDTIIFCEEEQEQLLSHQNDRIILVFFEACSGLKVNWRKVAFFLLKRSNRFKLCPIY